MDFVTHAAVGALVGRVTAPGGLSPTGARRYALAGAIVAVSPDADHVLEWFGAEAYLLHHRGPTHSLVLVAASALVVRLWGREPRGRHAALVAFALLSHLVLDVLTPYGTALFWPFSSEWIALDVLPIVCPWLTGLSVVAACVGAALARPGHRWPRRLAALSLLLVGAFVAVEAVVVSRARAAVERAAGVEPVVTFWQDDVGPYLSKARILTVPSWRNPLAAISCHEIVADEPWRYETWSVSPEGVARRLSVRPFFSDGGTPASDATVESVIARAARVPAWERFRLPILEVTTDEIVISDLQFELVEPGLRPIRVVVPRREGDVRVVQDHVGLQPFLYLGVVALAWAVSRRPAAWR